MSEPLYYTDRYGRHTRLVPLDHHCAYGAARLRAQYNISLPDALPAGTAIVAGCDAWLTNDRALQRIREISVLVLDELEP